MVLVVKLLFESIRGSIFKCLLSEFTDRMGNGSGSSWEAGEVTEDEVWFELFKSVLLGGFPIIVNGLSFGKSMS